MQLRRILVSLMLLAVFAVVGLILYDVIVQGNRTIPEVAAPLPTNTPVPVIIPTLSPLPPTATPLPTAVPPTEQVHVIQTGEQLTDVATLYGVSAESIAEYNGFSSTDIILQAGYALKIPPR